MIILFFSFKTKWVGKLDTEKLNEALNNPEEIDRKMLEESIQTKA